MTTSKLFTPEVYETLSDSAISLLAKYSYKADQFTDREQKDRAVKEYFKDVELNGITSRVIAQLRNKNLESIGYLEEHYVDSASEDYYYTIMIF